MPKIVFQGHMPVPHERLMQNVAHAHSLGLPMLENAREHYRRLAVVGGGPSARRHLKEIARFDNVISINGACGWLRENGIESTVLTLDPLPVMAERVKGAKKAILCSRCDPSVFEVLKDADITLFDVFTDTPGGVWASVSSVTSIFDIATRLGHRRTVFFGCEGSFEPDSTSHAYMNEAEHHEFLFEVECGGQKYLTAPDLYIQCGQMVPFLRLAVNESFTEESGGLLRAMVKTDEHDIVRVSKSLLAGLSPLKEAA